MNKSALLPACCRAGVPDNTNVSYVVPLQLLFGVGFPPAARGTAAFPRRIELAVGEHQLFLYVHVNPRAKPRSRPLTRLGLADPQHKARCSHSERSNNGRRRRSRQRPRWHWHCMLLQQQYSRRRRRRLRRLAGTARSNSRTLPWHRVTAKINLPPRRARRRAPATTRAAPLGVAHRLPRRGAPALAYIHGGVGVITAESTTAK